MAPSQYIKLQQVINVSEFVSLKKTRGSINIGYLRSDGINYVLVQV